MASATLIGLTKSYVAKPDRRTLNPPLSAS